MERWKERVYATYTDTAPNSHSARARLQRTNGGNIFVDTDSFLPRDLAAPILDIGCGTGGFLDALRSAGYSCVEGVDLSASQVHAAAARGVTGITHAPALDYLRTRSNRYATISAFSVLEHHTREELFELLDAVREALRPGGCLIAVVPNAKGLFGAHVRFADITHELSFTPMSVSQLCAVVGLDAPVVLRARAHRARGVQRHPMDLLAGHPRGASVRAHRRRRGLAMAGVHAGSGVRRAKAGRSPTA